MIRPSSIAFFVLTTLAATLLAGEEARAHESRPLYVELEERTPLVFSVRWKAPPSVPLRNTPEVSLPTDCAPLGASLTARAELGGRLFRCEGDPAGQAIEVHYPLFNPSVSTLVRVTWNEGQSQTVLGSPDETRIELPLREEFGTVALQYLALGIRHILEGYDHLLFLVCLLFIAGTTKRILITITGFTLAHSVTLVLSALRLVVLPTPPIEAAIALSIVFLAVEIVRGQRSSLTYRHPIIVASAFGLLHGFGFAAVLAETGLPQTELPAALFFFNLGVEVGQLLFVVLVVVAYRAVRRIVRSRSKNREPRDSQRGLQLAAAYVVGALASFWMIERIAGFWTV